MTKKTKCRGVALIGLPLMAWFAASGLWFLVHMADAPKHLPSIVSFGASVLAILAWMKVCEWAIAQREAGYIRCPDCGGYLKKVPLLMVGTCVDCERSWGIEKFEPEREDNSDGERQTGRG